MHLRIEKLLTATFVSLLVTFCASLTSFAGVITPELVSALQALAPHEDISVIIKLSENVDLSLIQEKDKSLRRLRIVHALKDKADLTQGPLKALLQNRGSKRLIPLWIINGIAVTVPAQVITELANFPGVESVTLDHIIQAPPVTLAAAGPAEWNINAIKAPNLWDIGFTGTGVVVANMDIGVAINHPDLNSRWRGGTNSWFNPLSDPANAQYCASPNKCSPCELSNTPCDADGHGTGTMGIMVGGSAGGTAIGVAPDAKWIAVKVLNDAGFGVSSIIHQGFQWILSLPSAEAPDVINNSWGETNVNRCDLTFEPDIQALRAAGIAVVFVAGNDGPGSSTSESPANNPGAFSVGATDNTNTIASFSSRGPSPSGPRCGNGSIFPNVVAPGVNIKTSDPFVGYIHGDGTSFSAPHVAGIMALLIGAFPDLTVSELESVLKQSALDLGTSGPDNDYGYGLVNGYDAYIQAFQLLFGQSVNDLIAHYYDSILHRSSDPEGLNFWTSEIQRLISLGIDVKEGLITAAKLFFNSSEYLQKNKPDDQYLIDLYQAFLNRTPSSSEVNFWVGYITGGASRNIVLNYFAFSAEFNAILEGVFGVSTTRPESNLINGFYRGFLRRTPDTGGVVYWIDLMRNAQCTGAQQVRDLSHQIALGFIHSAEYIAMGRVNSQYVEDLYDAILRRAAAPSEITYWLNILNGGTMTREQVLQGFTDSNEFQIRVQSVIDAGCL